MGVVVLYDLVELEQVHALTQVPSLHLLYVVVVVPPPNALPVHPRVYLQRIQHHRHGRRTTSRGQTLSHELLNQRKKTHGAALYQAVPKHSLTCMWAVVP